jgi:hypothetical protein
VSEPESEGELSAIKSKRTASEVGFSIPLAKRPELAEYSVTESESDTDVVSPSRLPTSGPTSAHGKGTATVHICDGLVLTSAPHSSQEIFAVPHPQMIQSQSRSRMTAALCKRLVTI